jgi:undecaprenyl-diphosphatase
MAMALRPPRHPFDVLIRLARREMWPLVGLGVVAALLLLFGALTAQVLEQQTLDFDRAIVLALRTDGDPADPIGPAWLEEVGRDITALGSFVVLGLAFVSVLGYLLLVRKRAAALLLAVAVPGGMLLSTVLKTVIDRDRPDVVQHAARVFTASFPSGHAMLAAVTFLTLGAMLMRLHPDRRVKAYFMSVAVVLTVLVGSSRLYLGVHYPTDVLAGWLAGASWAALCWVITARLQQRGALAGDEAVRPDAQPRG